MMKRIHKTAGLCCLIFCACLCARTAPAVSVTPSSATNYIFTTPLFPSSIRGVVMGDPPAYYTARGEDVDWMFEAYAERAALMAGRVPSKTERLSAAFGKWPLSETNRFARWTTAVDASGSTNIVVGYSLVTNMPHSGISAQDAKNMYAGMWYYLPTISGEGSRYLDGSAELTDAARVAYDYGHPPSFTNVRFNVHYESSSVSNFNTITMPMTNGTTSVFTNRWTAFILHPVTNSVVTNVVEACPLDYCHAGEGSFPELDVTSYDDLVESLATNAYPILRGANRLADETSTTNLVKYVHGSASSYEDEDGTIIYPWSASTNLTQTAKYSISGDHTVWASSWNKDSHAYDVYYRVYVTENVTEAYEAIAPTRFKSDLVTTGGVVRVEIEAAFAFVEFGYTKYLEEGTAPNYNNVLDVAIDKLVIVPLESHSLDITHKDALARVKIDAKAICQKASLECGAPNPPNSAAEYNPSKGEIHSWSVECKVIVLIYRTHPSSKFSSW